MPDCTCTTHTQNKCQYNCDRKYKTWSGQ